MKKLLVAILLMTTCAFGSNLKPIFKQVSKEYSVSYELLSKMSWIESNHRINARTKTSSARGLYQIIRSTEKWLKEICDIEGDIFDPLTNTRLAACYIKHNQNYLTRKLKRRATDLECYEAHFFGARTAFRFISIPNHRLGYKSFRKESKANPSIFWHKKRPRTIGEIKRLFRDKLNKAKVL